MWMPAKHHMRRGLREGKPPRGLPHQSRATRTCRVPCDSVPRSANATQGYLGFRVGSSC